MSTDNNTKLGRWMEEYKCGCTNVLESKADAVGYCPKHGDCLRHLYKLREWLPVGLAK